MTPDQIDKTLIQLKVDNRDVLFIILAEDGTINRKGDGSPDCKDNDLYLGLNKDGLFNQLKPFITEDMEQFLKHTYTHPEQKGRQCELKILFGANGEETGAQFFYGELSQGPPKPFTDFVIKAVQLTDPWHQAQKKMARTAAAKKNTAPTPEKKSWWKFWQPKN